MKKLIVILCALCFTFISNAQENEDIASLKEDAEKGEVEAQLKLAGYYALGQGELEQSYEKSFYWTNKAAEQGNPNAQGILGVYYYEGIGVEKSYSRAVYWYTKAAEQGNPNAQGMLGACYYEGKGIEKSKNKAIYWFRKACENFNDDACEILNKIK